jgi:hypothetical protein
MSAIDAYLFILIPSLESFFIFLSFPLLSLSLVLFAQLLMEDYINEERLRREKNAFRVAGLTLVSMLLAVVLPSRADMLTMAGIYVGSHALVGVSELEGVKELPQNVIDSANSWLKGISNSEEKK